MSKLCGECGNRTVVPLAVAGRTSPFRQFGALPIPADFQVPTCSTCGAEWYDRKTSEQLDAVLAEAANQQLARLATEAIEHLAQVMNQRDLEVQLGLSAGYLSKVRHGKERPSAPLVALLSLLATRTRRIGEVERVWATGQLSLRLTDDNLTRVDAELLTPAAVAL